MFCVNRHRQSLILFIINYMYVDKNNQLKINYISYCDICADIGSVHHTPGMRAAAGGRQERAGAL